MITRAKKYEYFNHFVARFVLEGVGGGYGPTRKITGRRLYKAIDAIMADDALWTDVLIRHNGVNFTPEKMMECWPRAYEHLLSNFWGRVNSIMAELGLI
jgi:hypothetical protein